MLNVFEACKRTEETKKLMPEINTTSTSPFMSQFILNKLRSTSFYRSRRDNSVQVPQFPAANPDDSDDIPQAPSPDVFTIQDGANSGVPSLAQAATHLLLLEVFWAYKSRFSPIPSDPEVRTFFARSFGWEDNDNESRWEEDGEDIVWKLVIEIAVGRFEAWWKIVGRHIEGLEWDEKRGNRVSNDCSDLDIGKETESYKPEHGPSKNITDLPKEMLPPLDVLMVWHSYMLNPRCYYDDCFALGVPSMLSIRFPWNAINATIDQTTLEYKLPPEVEIFFKTSTSQHADLLQQLKSESYSTPRIPSLEITCPNCDWEHQVCITESSLTIPQATTGWSNEAFSKSCECGFVLDHSAMCAERLRQDINQVIRGGPGVRGSFSPPFKGQEINTLIRDIFKTPPTLSNYPTMDSLTEVLSGSDSKAKLVDMHLKPFYLTTSPQQSASLSLMQAVIRQSSFYDKMHHNLWIRSPSLCSKDLSGAPIGTLPRARRRYDQFFSMFSKFPGETMVPTLDIDLFWHTHQLSPASYYYYSFEQTERFIDHNDKLSSGILDTGFERTEKRFSEMFGEEYGGCFCWSCELEKDTDERNPQTEKKSLTTLWKRKSENRRNEWERKVLVKFWREVETNRRAGETEHVGLAGLQSVLKEGPLLKKK